MIEKVCKRFAFGLGKDKKKVGDLLNRFSKYFVEKQIAARIATQSLPF